MGGNFFTIGLLYAGTMLASGMQPAFARALAPAEASGAHEGGGSDAAGGENAIVVTALRRNQRLQDVPAAVSVLDTSALENRNAKDFRDYLNSVPGVTQGDNGYRGSRLIIRGVSAGLNTAPLAGIYIDEAPVTEGGQPTFDPSLDDVERVEVLKGPQGTLYGSGSMGGTVRVILNKPVLNAIEGSVEGSVGAMSDGGTNYRASGVVNIPVVTDLAALRVSASYRRDGGFIDDTLRNVTDANTIEKTNVRAALRVAPGSNTTVDLSFLYQDENLGSPNFGELFPGNPPRYTQRKAYPQTGPAKVKLYGLTVNQDLGFADLISATNYLDKSAAANIDATSAFSGLIGQLTGVRVPATEGFGLNTYADLKLFTQEVRLSSSNDGWLQWIVGGYYANTKTNSGQYADIAYAPSVSGLITGAQMFVSTTRDRSEQFAGFGEVTVQPFEKLSLTAGLRAFDVRQHSDLMGSGVLNGGTSNVQTHAKASKVIQKYLISFKPEEDHLIYAQASQGFRAGGANGNIPVATCGADLANLGYGAAAPSQYSPDTLWNYELGSKNTLFGNRMTLNAAGYYIKWSKIQSTVALPTCNFSFTGNAGAAEIKGVDLDATIKPIDGLSIGGAVSYIDSQITETAPGITPKVGDRLPLVAKWSWSANAQYTIKLDGGSSLFLYGDVNRVSSRRNTFAGAGVNSSAVIPGYTLANARLGINRDKWSVSLFATNVFNRYYAVNRAVSRAQIYDIVGEPRVIGISSKIGF